MLAVGVRCVGGGGGERGAACCRDAPSERVIGAPHHATRDGAGPLVAEAAHTKSEILRRVEAVDVVRVRGDDGVSTRSGTRRYRGVDDIAGLRPGADGAYRERFITVRRRHLDALVAEEQMQPMLPWIGPPDLSQRTARYGERLTPTCRQGEQGDDP